ncbi:hypothetical protein M5689_010154 [Euphorbia peplus]|nr:hypothetical protein M5689_010154 [Euphorbia peplus]
MNSRFVPLKVSIFESNNIGLNKQKDVNNVLLVSEAKRRRQEESALQKNDDMMVDNNKHTSGSKNARKAGSVEQTRQEK